VCLGGSGAYRSQEAELAVDVSPTREVALGRAILAAELYMTASKQAASDLERAKLRNKCLQLTSRAESIKLSNSWPPLQSNKISLRAPVSQRPLTKREEIILLEGSKLHGFIFPPWTTDPDDALFAGDENGLSTYTCVLCSRFLLVLLLTISEIPLI
jgi:calpain-7